MYVTYRINTLKCGNSHLAVNCLVYCIQFGTHRKYSNKITIYRKSLNSSISFKFITKLNLDLQGTGAKIEINVRKDTNSQTNLKISQ